jgi:hypothetical protein
MSLWVCRFRRQGIVFLLLLCCLLASCGKKEEIQLVPPVTPPLSRGEVGYGVVNVSYTHVVDKPDSQALSLGYLRRGSVVRVLERRQAGYGQAAQVRPRPWVLVEGHGDLSLDSPGWLPESVVDIYFTAAQAQTAAESLLQ